MNWNDRLHLAVDRIFAPGEQPPPGNVRSLSQRRKLTDEDVSEFLASAEDRANPLIMQMLDLIEQNKAKNPVRTARLQRDMRWLLDAAHKAGYPWGQPCKWWQRL